MTRVPERAAVLSPILPLNRLPAVVSAFAAGIAALLMLTGADPAEAVPAKQAISNLNKQRKANGIPAGLVARPALNRGCRKHNRWMQMNGVLAHAEEPGTPGYTPEGDLAARQSVLGWGTAPWRTARDNRWETAPLHLTQLLDPSLLNTGYDESHGFFCAQTLTAPRRKGPARPRLHTYPGPGSPIYRGERAAESPYTPGELAGIPQGRLTGPYIHLMVAARAPGGSAHPLRRPARILAASLRPAGGKPVALARIDTRDLRLQAYVPPGGYLIPRRPLKAGKKYVAKVKLRYAGKTLKRTWRFRTRARIIG